MFKKLALVSSFEGFWSVNADITNSKTYHYLFNFDPVETTDRIFTSLL